MCRCFGREVQKPSSSLWLSYKRSSRARNCKWYLISMGWQGTWSSDKRYRFLRGKLNRGERKKSELRVSYEESDFSFLSAKSTSVPKELPPKGVIQTLRHKDQRLHLLDWRDGRIPQEVTSVWGKTVPTRRRYPRASGFSLPKECHKELIIKELDSSTKGLMEVIEFCERLETAKEIIQTQVKGNHQNKKPSSTLNATNTPSRHKAKVHTRPRNPWKRMQKKTKKKKFPVWPLHGPGYWSPTYSSY